MAESGVGGLFEGLMAAQELRLQRARDIAEQIIRHQELVLKYKQAGLEMPDADAQKPVEKANAERRATGHFGFGGLAQGVAPGANGEATRKLVQTAVEKARQSNMQVVKTSQSLRAALASPDATTGTKGAKVEAALQRLEQQVHQNIQVPVVLKQLERMKPTEAAAYVKANRVAVVNAWKEATVAHNTAVRNVAALMDRAKLFEGAIENPGSLDSEQRRELPAFGGMWPKMLRETNRQLLQETARVRALRQQKEWWDTTLQRFGQLQRTDGAGRAKNAVVRRSAGMAKVTTAGGAVSNDETDG